MRRKPLKLLIVISLSGLLIVVVLEVVLRSMGYRPFKPVAPVSQTKSHEFDKNLGWKLIPGDYEIGPFNDIGDSMSITIKKDTGRVTRINNNGVGDDQITFIGGSYMMGYGLDDNETAVWKLQQRFPHSDFRNLAVSGYGTFQSLLVLEDELKKGNRPKCVIYGAFQHHQLRNVAQGAWLMQLRRKIPYVTLQNDSTFQRNESVGMYNLRLTEKLALASLAERVVNWSRSFKRVKDAQKLTHLIIREMQRLCREYGIVFYVATLHYLPEDMKYLRPFLDESNIRFIDCHVPLTRDNSIKDDGHPDEGVNDIWVERIADRLTKDGITCSAQ